MFMDISECSLPDAIDSIARIPEGSRVSVIGPPGSGKTSLLLSLLEKYSESFEPEEVLVLAPGRLLANRLNGIALPALLKEKKVRSGRLVVTPASFAFRIVQNSMKGERPTLLSGADEDQVIAETIAQNCELFKSSYARSPNFRSRMRFFIEDLSRHGIDPAHLGKIDRWKTYAALIEKYRLARTSNNAFTAVEIIERAAQLASTGYLPYRVIMVDEAQELAAEHMRLFSALARRNITVILFGDPDKAVARSASPSIFLDFSEKLFVLKTVFRTPRNLHLLSQKICQGIGVTGSVLAHRQSFNSSILEGRVETVISSSRATSMADIARWFREKHLLEGIDWEDMALIIFQRSSAEVYSHFLERFGVPVQILGGGLNLSEKPIAGAILNAIELACFPDILTGKTLVKLLLSPIGGFDVFLMRKLTIELKRIAPKNIQVLNERLLWAFHAYRKLQTQDTDEVYRAFLASRIGRSLKKIFECLISLERLYREDNASLPVLIWHVYSFLNLKSTVSKEPWQTSKVSHRVLEEVIALQKLADAVSKKDPLCSAGLILQKIINAEVPVDNLSIREKRGCVTILTPASSVGYEYRAVVITDIQGSHKMDSTQLDPELALADINNIPFSRYLESKLAGRRHNLLRTLYQAVTRSTSDLLVSVIDSAETSPSWLFYAFFSDYPSCELSSLPLTLRGIVTQLRLDLERDPGNTEVASALRLLAKEGISQADPQNWYGYLSRTENKSYVIDSIKPSVLDKFHTCPLGWFTDQLDCNRYPGNATEIGTIIHRCMQELTCDNRQPNLNEFLDYAYAKLREADFESRWVLEREKKRLVGIIRKLVDYLIDFDAHGGTLLASEKSFSFDLNVFKDRSITISGQIDRLERLSSGEIRIVDLKTSSSLLSKNDAESNLQLSAYQLAVEHLDIVYETLPSAMLIYPAVGTKKAAIRIKGPMDRDSKRVLKNTIRDLLLQNESFTLTAALEEHCESRTACKKLMVPHVSFSVK